MNTTEIAVLLTTPSDNVLAAARLIADKLILAGAVMGDVESEGEDCPVEVNSVNKVGTKYDIEMFFFIDHLPEHSHVELDAILGDDVLVSVIS